MWVFFYSISNLIFLKRNFWDTEGQKKRTTDIKYR